MHKAHDLPVNTASHIKKDGRQPKRHAIVKTHFSGLTCARLAIATATWPEAITLARTVTGIMAPGIDMTRKEN